MKTKFTVEDLKELFHISEDEILKFIKLGLLVPDKWPDKGEGFIEIDINNITDEFDFCIWDIKEIDKFSTIINLIKDQYLSIYHTINSRLNEIESNLINKLGYLSGKLTNLRSDFIKFRYRIERKELMIDAIYFCEITGYTTNYFRKKVKKLDEEGQIMRLQISFYKSLIWHKIKGRWLTPFIDFEELRSNFRYELYIQEQKRKGVFKPTLPKIDKELFQILSKKDLNK